MTDSLEILSDVFQPVPLIYPSDINNQSQYINVLLINDQVKNYESLVNSVNSNTFPIVYSYASSKTELLNLLKSYFTEIKRIGLIFYTSNENIPLFLDSEQFFENSNDININTQFIINLIKEFNVSNIDYLACNTLLYTNWKSYYDSIMQYTNVTIGASDNNTGNIKYGGDWIMESTNEDIEFIYFSYQIEYYSYLLDILTITINNVIYTYDTISGTAYTSGLNSAVRTYSANIPSYITDTSYNSYNVTSIGASTFLNNIYLTSVTLPNSITSIGNSAFAGCTALSSFTIPSLVTSIGTSAFSQCRTFTSLILPNSLTSIGGSAFGATNNLTSIVIPASVTSLPDYLFWTNGGANPASGATSCTVLGPVTSINNTFTNAFNLKNVILPSTLTSIPGSAFQSCTSLQRLVIPKSVVNIYSAAFNSCSSLTYLYLPNSFKNFSGPATFLNGCTSLTTVYMPAGNVFGITPPSNGPVTLTYSVYSSAIQVNVAVPLTPLQNYNNGISVYLLMTEFNFTILEMYTSGILVSQLISGGLTILQLYNGGVTTAQLYDGGISVSQLINAGLSILQIYNGGVTSNQLYFGGVSVSQLSAVPLSVAQLYNGGISIINLYNGGITVKQLRNIGILVSQLYYGGITVQQLYDGGVSSSDIILSNICFPAGTPITTNQGNIPIELINPDIHTIRYKKIVGITQTVTPDKYLVCFEKDALGANIPSQKTIITKSHEIFYKGKMIKARDFIGKFENVRKIKYTGEVLYNVLMEKHDKMIVNNLICETLNPENTVAQLYKILQTLPPEKQRNVIEEYNEFSKRTNIYAPKKNNK